MTRSESQPVGGAAGTGVAATVVCPKYDRPVDVFFFSPSLLALDISDRATLHPATESASAASDTASFNVERMASPLLMLLLLNCAVARSDRDGYVLRSVGPDRGDGPTPCPVRPGTRIRSSSC